MTLSGYSFFLCSREVESMECLVLIIVVGLIVSGLNTITISFGKAMKVAVPPDLLRHEIEAPRD